MDVVYQSTSDTKIYWPQALHNCINAQFQAYGKYGNGRKQTDPVMGFYLLLFRKFTIQPFSALHPGNESSLA